MGDDDDLELNRLDRFSKRSPRLVLEEYSHCEVPAGCGGVVLRWRDDADGLTVVFQGASPGQITLTIDGADPPSAFAQLAYGDHLLAIHLHGIEVRHAVFGLAARQGGKRASETGKRPIAPLCTADDGSWKHTRHRPDDDAWQRPDFDDRDWAPLVRGRLPRNLEKHEAWPYERVEEAGARLLALPKHTEELWIRKRLTLTPEDGRGGTR